MTLGLFTQPLLLTQRPLRGTAVAHKGHGLTQILGAQAPSLGLPVSVPRPTSAQQYWRRRSFTVSRLNPELGAWRSRFIALDPVSNALNTNHDIMTGTSEP